VWSTNRDSRSRSPCSRSSRHLPASVAYVGALIATRSCAIRAGGGARGPLMVQLVVLEGILVRRSRRRAAAGADRATTASTDQRADVRNRRGRMPATSVSRASGA